MQSSLRRIRSDSGTLINSDELFQIQDCGNVPDAIMFKMILAATPRMEIALNHAIVHLESIAPTANGVLQNAGLVIAERT